MGGAATLPLNENVKSASPHTDAGITPGRGASFAAVGGGGHGLPLGITVFRCVPEMPHQTEPVPSAYSRCAGIGRRTAAAVPVPESIRAVVPTPIVLRPPEPTTTTGVGVPIGPESTVATSVTIRAGLAGSHAKIVRVTRGIPQGHRNGAAAVGSVSGTGQAIIGPPEISTADAIAESVVGVPSMLTLTVATAEESPARPAAP